MMTKNKYFSFHDNLSFENLSSLINDLGIMALPMSNEQKVCIEHPNINLENQQINIFETKKDSDNIVNDENEHNENKLNDKSSTNEYILNLSRNKTYTINPKKLYKEFSKNMPYTIEEFKNSLKIFISIINSFNEDLFKWNLEDFNLFNKDNQVQMLIFNKDNNSTNDVNSEIEKLYKKHFSVNSDLNEVDIIDVIKDKKDIKVDDKSIKTKCNKVDDFEDDFDLSISVNHKNKSESNDSNDDENVIKEKISCYENDKIFRNIYLLMNFFNLLNNFNLSEFNLDNILKNITLLNSYIINDYKILLLLCFNISIQINLFINKITVNKFLKIDENKDNNNSSQNKINNKIVNNFYPNIFYIDYLNKVIAKEENELHQEQIIFLNIILKFFNLTFLVKNKIALKINIKIFSIDYFKEIKTKLIIQKSVFAHLHKINNIFNYIQKNDFVDLFCSNSSCKESFSFVTFEQILIKDIDINQLNEISKLYYPLIVKSDFVSFDTLENYSLIKYPLNNYLNELVILEWTLKFILKIIKYSKNKYAFSFVFNSFSIALKNDTTNKDNNINIKDLMIYMGIYHYDENEMLKFISESTNFNLIYKKYKDIIKQCDEYKNYNIGIRLFKNGIINKELQYYFITIILSLSNSIHLKNKEFHNNIVLYESKYINSFKCIFFHFKKKNSESKKTKKKPEILISQSIDDNLNIHALIKNNNLNGISPTKKRHGRNSSIFGALKFFNKNKNIEQLDNNINIDSKCLTISDKANVKNDKIQETNKKFNNFLKQISDCSFISDLESTLFINFVSKVKNYFSDFLLYIQKNIKINNKNFDEKDFIFEKSSDNSFSFDPMNLLREFNNNKCFIVLKDFSNIDLYIYLYDFYDNNYQKENKNNKSKSEIFNEIIKNINVFKEECNKNFVSKTCSIVIDKVNFILHKYFLILNQYFYDNKIFFNEENNIIILDKFTHTDCIFSKGHITIVSNNNYEKNNDKDDNNKDENYFVKFYSAFLYEYDIIKYILDKKIIKLNKLDIIVKRKILQINNGQIQLKKINLNNNKNYIFKTSGSKEINFTENNMNELIKNNDEENKNNINNNDNENKSEDNINFNDKLENKLNKLIKNENYNLFKIKDLFKYTNSYPLIIFFLKNETEISNLSFLLFTFYEIFLSKSFNDLSKDILIKRIIKFFHRFKNSELIPIIFNKKYFIYFLKVFDSIINKIRKSNTSGNNTSRKEHHQIFKNIILYPINELNVFDDITNLLNENIFNNLTIKISIFKIGNEYEIPYNINQVGKMFKFHRLVDTVNELEKISNLNNHDETKIIIHKINPENLKILLKKNQKKVKFIGIDKDDRPKNVQVFNGNDIITNYKDENLYDKNNGCYIF